MLRSSTSLSRSSSLLSLPPLLGNMLHYTLLNPHYYGLDGTWF